MTEETPPPPPAFGGAEPSQIIDPGEFEAVAGRLAESTGIQLLNMPESEHHRFRGAMAYVVAAYEEMLKFLPPDQDAIPSSAFVSEVGRARYQRDPRNYERGILEMNVRDARAVLDDIDEVSARGEDTTSGG
ncbi:hypothetical protein E4N62_15535 [Streptomyces sp. MNU76]|uniref:hypothetical protein n=1 Tax=Streptomyces sp. MNU76 TaxID=2560026 RepID=UPI001E546443|nr:hypothetical protein [Streptomyces sp. MNU76]MCC9706558.1 hypothetical protein [Streptomyces sp. MNU76]